MAMAWHLAARPEGVPTLSDFKLKDIGHQPLGEGMIRVRNHWLSVDPHIRLRMDPEIPFVRYYYPPYEIDGIIDCGAVGEVIESRAEGFAPGDIVGHFRGMRDETVVPARETWPAHMEGIPEQAFIGLLGHTGATAYFGFRAAEPKSGEVIFVSGAAGAVGSTVVQLAKLKGMTVIGSCGGAEKCAMVRELGADFALDYKASPILDQLAAVAPGGIDVFYDNVGGDHFEAALALARVNARFSSVGTVANYNTGGLTTLKYMLNIPTHRIQIKGVVATDYASEFPAFIGEMADLLRAGKIQLCETVRDGLENVPSAFIEMLAGGNKGKMLIRL
jgi:NADPH-dependent curcumin reductase CurA